MLSESTREAIAGGADAVIVTGTATGSAPSLIDVCEVKAAADTCPVLLGSGVSVGNARALLAVADGAIVGSALKTAYEPGVPVDVARVRALIAVLRSHLFPGFV